MNLCRSKVVTALSDVEQFGEAGTVSAGWLIDNVDPRLVPAVCFGLRAGTLFLLPVLLTAHISVPLVAFVVAFGVLDVATVPPTPHQFLSVPHGEVTRWWPEPR
jgi:hypothetical protein